jgi:Putative metal-binding motif
MKTAKNKPKSLPVPALSRSMREPSLLALALTGFLAAGCDDPATPLPDGMADSGGSDSSSSASSGTAIVDTSDAASGDAGAVEDRDRDGITPAQGDCDDFNRLAFPGAEERSGDGVDSDCDGEDAPIMALVWGKEAEENLIDAAELMDSNGDGAVSIEEFNAQCAKSAQLLGDARPGILQFHASCAGTNACRGMVYQAWDEVYEHSCRGVNYCAGWSCVETAEDQQRTGDDALAAGHCTFCHTPGVDEPAAAFALPVPPSLDPAAYLEGYWDRQSDERLRSIIAFGVRYIAPNGYAVSNMPEAYNLLSRSEIDALIQHLRTKEVVGHPFDLPGAPHPALHGDAGETADAGPSDTGTGQAPDEFQDGAAHTTQDAH